MVDIAVIAVLAVFGVTLAEVGRRAVLGRWMVRTMSRLRPAEAQQAAWPEAGPRAAPGGGGRPADVQPGSELVPGSGLRRAS
ncbi:MAG: hypothetical protein ACYCX8_02910 [Acidimicrobiales bacterium]|jgi:hypothetical protein